MFPEAIQPIFFLILATFAGVSFGLPVPTNSSVVQQCGIAGPQGHDGFFPWMAYVEAVNPAYSFTCTATVISQNYILTAAHCVEPGWDTTVYVGASDYQLARQTVKVVGVGDPEFRELPNHEHVADVGVLKLKTPLQFDGQTIGPICLGGKFEVGQEATIAGWGMQSFPIGIKLNEKGEPECQYADEEKPVYKMKIGEVKVTNSEECDRDPSITKKYNGTHVCIKPLDATPESGDSGGPLLIRDAQSGQWRQIGITSEGQCQFPKEERYDPSIYTSVNHYCGWIKEQTEGEVGCDDSE